MVRYAWRRSLLPVAADSKQIRERFDGRPNRTRLPHLDDVQHTPAVVILGERGCGKSVALAQEHTRLLETGLPVTFLHLGKDVFDITSAGTQLHQDLRTAVEADERFVLLDGLDEGMSDIPGLDKALLHHLRALSETERHGLRLRITCRTTRWPAALETGLRTLWPKADQVAVKTLAPLTRADLHTAAGQHGLDGADFVTQVADRNLQALAQQPVTLIPLLEARVRGVALPATVAQAYAQACRTLCTETWEEDFSRRQGRPGVDHLLAVARWTAAALQFSRCPALVDQPPAGEGELDLDTLAAPQVPGAMPPLECRRRELLYLTECGLLTPVGQRRWVFAHRSFQEYLAAEFLRISRIGPTVLKELLWVGGGRARHIVPEHEEIAARLAVDDEQLFDDLLAHDLPVLLLADLKALPARQRARVTQALLDRAPEEDLGPLVWGRFDRVNHPGLAAQLTPFLASDADRDQQYLALRIASMCRPDGLAPALLAVAEDTAQPVGVRSLALQALDQVDDQTADRLMLLAADPVARIAEEAVMRLWPERLSATEYLDLLPAPNPQAVHGLLDKTTALMTPERAAELLDWSVHTLHTHGAKAAWATDLVAQAIAHLAHADTPRDPHPLEEQVGQALVAVAAYSERCHETGAHAAFEELKAALAGAPALRRRLAGYLLRHSTADDILQFAFAVPQPGMFPDDDLLHWFTRWSDLSAETRQAIHPLISRRPRPDQPQLREAVDRARQSDPMLREATAWWDAPEPQWLLRRREREAQERHRHTFDEALFAVALQDVTTAGPQTVRQAWHTAVAHLYRTADGTRVTPATTLNAVAAAPSIPLPGSDLHDALVIAARHVLITAPVIAAEDIPGWRTGYQQLPELSALGFLPTAIANAAVPQEESSRWAGWALALATLTDPADDTALRHALLRHCAHRAGPAFVTAVEDRLQRTPSRLDELAEVLLSLSLHEAIDTLYCWASSPEQPRVTRAEALAALAQHGYPQARERLAGVVASGPHGDGPQHRTRWIKAVHTLMSCNGLADIWPAVRRQLTDQDLFTELTDQLIDHPGHRDWPRAITDLTASDLADLYTRLCRRPELQQPRPLHQPGVLYTITYQETLHDRADTLLQLIAAKATTAAADELDQLSRTTARNPRYPARLARRTARQAARRQLEPVPAHQLHQLAVDHSLRVIADETHLLDVVMEALDTIQEALSGPNGLAILLWSRSAVAASSSMWPLWEEDFSDFVMGLLKIHLGKRRVILNREVQVDRPGAGGGRTDIHIQAATNTEDPEPFTVVIECKGCWNPGLDTALADQLVGRYLRRPRTAGIFLVGFFDCHLWNDQHRPRCAPAHSRQAIEQQQQAQAARHNAVVRAKVLDCRPPGVQTD
jgi:hypothetical protein